MADVQVSLESIRATREAIAREIERQEGGLLAKRFTDETRPGYPKHLAFFAAGREERTRLMLAANRVGKTECGLFETALHLTGLYPDWWTGRRFTTPVRWWVCGDTTANCRDILQARLIGPPDARGTGFLPSHTIQHMTMQRGVGDAVEQIWVKHVSGGLSLCQIRSYAAGREAFQGTAQHGILLDEEPPEDVYAECVMRSVPTGDFVGGILMLTFTPLAGLTPLVNSFLSGEAGLWYIQIGWDDVPHIGESEREAFRRQTPPYLRDARFRGVPSLGAGNVYPFSLDDDNILVDDFPVPEHWARGFGLDAQPLWKSHVIGAHDRDNDVLYLTHAWKRERVEPAVQAEAIKAVAPWIPGVGDAAALVADSERRQYIDVYRTCGLTIELPVKAVEAGIQQVYDRLATGRLKVFRRSCEAWVREYSAYHRDAKTGRIVKRDDHLQDCARYLVAWISARGPSVLKTRAEAGAPKLNPYGPPNRFEGRARPYAWMS